MSPRLKTLVALSTLGISMTLSAHGQSAPASAAPAGGAKPAAAAPASGNATAAPTELPVGAAAPAIKGVNQDGKTVDLAELYKTGYVLVYFYPKAGTKGCTDQACSLRDAYADLTKEKLIVVGVSHDTVEDQKKFATLQKLPFDLIADTKGEVYKAFGVPGLRNREAFLIKNGKIIWEDTTASTTKQADDVKQALAADKAPAAK